MDKPIITIKNLSKRYNIDHQRGHYVALRDVLTTILKNPFDFLKHKAKTIAGMEKKEIFWALKDINLEIKKGEVIGIIGQNGAGKSTLLKILSQITPPTTGEIEINGRVGSLLEVGTGFHPELSGRENIFLNAAILGMTKKEIAEKFDQIVEFAGIEKFLDTPVKRYSSGMYVRLAFSVAAHMEPDILIVDEVLAVGDAEFQKKCLGKMDEVTKKEGRTILFVSHNMAAISRLCSKTVHLEKGKLVQCGPTAEVIASYAKHLDDHSNKIKLADRTDRRGERKAVYTDMWFENISKEKIASAISGQPITIVISYQASEPNILKNCRASISVKNRSGEIMFLCSSELTNPETMNLPEKGILRCNIDSLPLSRGNYVISVFLEANKQVQDWVDEAATLEVTDGDFYGTGALYPTGWEGKGVLIKHTWSW